MPRNLLALFLSCLVGMLALSACGRARTLAEEGIVRLEQGRQTSALELFDRALRSNPKEPLALYGKGILLSEEQITEDIARSMLTQATQQEKLSEKYRIKAYLRIAELAASRNDRDATLQNLAKISITHPAVDPQVVRHIASLYLQLKEKTRARDLLTTYRESHPKDMETEYFLFRLYTLELKDFKAAAKLCAKVNWKTAFPEKYDLNCARVLASINDFPAALELVNGYLTRKGANAEKNAHDLRDSIAKK
ncbi:MAG TPA: tetratricopeptide repeat protein, partial [Turneriella sp.]|nr:tetratricopeptide repeat protein [Turneriella sp.]